MPRLYLLLFFLLLTSRLMAQSPVVQFPYPTSFTVAKDGSGNFKTIQEAVNSVRDLSQVQVLIYIKNGTYREKLVVPSWKTNISLIGESEAGTIITGDDYAGKPFPGGIDATGRAKFITYTTHTVLIEGNDIILENLTIENTANRNRQGPRVEQAVALHVEGDRCIVRHCRLLGHQDTLYMATSTSRQLYQDCYIEGTVDFLFGEATVVFQRCTIKSLANSWITAASTRPGQPFGFVFLDCALTADSSVTSVYLGRPWRPYARTVFIRTQMGPHIRPEGWDNWAKTTNYKTTFYAEYQSRGPGATPQQRVDWAKQLTDPEAAQYTLKRIFDSDSGWNPAPGLTYRRDTSFTVSSAYLNARKKHPQISIADPKLAKGVTVAANWPYCTRNGKTLFLDAFYPPVNPKKPRPAVLLIHGGGWRTGDRSMNVAMAKQLANAGYVAVTVDYRLSTDSLYPAAVHDLKDAVRWLRAQADTLGIDTSRIAAMGCSAGGQLAALLGTTGDLSALEGSGCTSGHSSIVQAIVDVDGLLAFDHPESGEGDDSRATSAATHWFGGPKTETVALWREASPLTYVNRTDTKPAPILILNSSVDRMHAGRDALLAVYKARGIYTEVYTFADAPHPFWLFNPWFEPTMQYTMAFLKRVLR
ncbi:pectinesterase family protein [Spirosoma rhododendri]|uniref:Pectinesterase n=1 Tax=Spirosoma rhododendri TaxID=2728024 RepID=A0A7L5DNW3_9BACT|nr:pectinesterase family protein [Spirosoma rhododendri]QJD80184.1 alpha/beta hydrolase fold domain-containing protein [Spirosoma rhododendri]